MKKILFILMLLVSCIQAKAQFEQGSWFANASLTGLNLSHSSYEGTNFGISVSGGTFVGDCFALVVNFKGEFIEKGHDQTTYGAGIRYYFGDCGVYAGFGLAHKHLSNEEFRKNITCFTPEVGYAFMINDNFAVEPVVYYDLSLKHTSDYSKLGFKIGFGIYF
ncbi:outer membrane beta-barrel protein [uncultured Bacteroides sp.]|uniref:outer membrane beta-barrel protein n=1 Tax=uncultured Bacteroides sp. TaxID=162156 RepID=UPI002610F7F3|nr:outer membrane beta-barrel protein [uncultured Bacteroides sp.]